MKKSKSVQKLITFPRGLYERLMAKADTTGVGFSDYIRHVTIKYLEDGSTGEILDGEQEIFLEKSLKELKNGEYTEYSNMNDLINDLHKEVKSDI